jgi:hypothetical protein
VPQNQTGSPLKFVHGSAWQDLEDLIENPTRLHEKLAHHILNTFFDDRFGYQVELPGVKTYLAGRIAGDLLGVIDKKLKRQYPHGATKQIRARQLEQALAYLKDVWIEDFIKHPKDPLAKKCQRMLPLLKSWPNADMRKRPEHGRAAQLWYLGIYTDVSDNALKAFPRGPNTVEIRDQREKSLKDAFHEFRLAVAGRRKMDVFHPETKELFVDASEEDIKRWSKFSKYKVALEITSKILARIGVQITANTLHRMLPELRRFDRQLETVEKSLQKSK